MKMKKSCGGNGADVLITKLHSISSVAHYQKLMHHLPRDQKEKNQSFVQWKDRYSHLLGRLLLKSGLRMYGYSENCLFQLKYDSHQRPYIQGDIDFNISHSGNIVMCVLGRNLKLGIDIEKIQPIDFSTMEGAMTESQWAEIKQSAQPLRKLVQYWAIKESVIKGDGRGLAIPLRELHIIDDKIVYNNNTWHLHLLDVDLQYCACMATNVDGVSVKLHYMDLDSGDNFEYRIIKREQGHLALK